MSRGLWLSDGPLVSICDTLGENKYNHDWQQQFNPMPQFKYRKCMFLSWPSCQCGTNAIIRGNNTGHSKSLENLR